MSNYFFNFDKMSYLKGDKPEGCILCHIASGSDKVPDLTVWHNSSIIVSVNLYPYNPGHLLVFPRRHIRDIREYSETESLQMEAVTRAMLDILDKTHAPFAFNIGYNMGLTAGASIEHIHRHIIPRYPRETGISDLIAGKKLLAENPLVTCERIKEFLSENPLSL